MSKKLKRARRTAQAVLCVPGSLCAGAVFCTAGTAQSLWMIGFLVTCGVALMLARLP